MSLYALCDAGHVTLPEPVLRMRRARLAIEPAMHGAEAEARQVHADVEASAAALVDAAASGALPGDIGADTIAREARQHALRRRWEVLERADAMARSREDRAWREHADLIGRALLGALDGLLARAALPARAVRDARLDYADPASLLRQPKAVQSAYATLEPLAPLHDELRQGALEVLRRAPDWQGIADLALASEAYRENVAARPVGAEAVPAHGYERAGGFAGHGLVPVRRSSAVQQAGQPLPLVWAWRPEGHPVGRLVSAAMAAAELHERGVVAA